MKKPVEIKYNLRKIDEVVHELQILKNRANACSSMKYSMQNSEGDSKDAFLDTFDAMTECAASVAIMISNMIDYLNFAKTNMMQADASIKKRLPEPTA